MFYDQKILLIETVHEQLQLNATEVPEVPDLLALEELREPFTYRTLMV